MIDWNKVAEVQNLELNKHKAQTIDDLIQWLDSRANEVSGKVPEAERSTWDAKEASAVAIINGTATVRQIKFVEIEAAVMGETVEVTCQKILQNVAMFYIAGPLISGLRRRAWKKITEATTQDDIDNAVAKLKSDYVAVMSDPVAFSTNPKQYLQGLNS